MKTEQKVTKISWPLIIICVSAFLGVASWQLCFLEYPYSSIFDTMRLFLALLVIGGILQIVYQVVQIKITYRFATIVAICCISLGAVAPVYTYWYGTAITQKFTDALAITISVESRTINFFDYVDDTGFPRNIHTIYKLETDRAIVEEKIRQQLKPENGWKFLTERFLATCALSVTTSDGYFWGTGGNEIWIDENNSLHVLIFFRSPQRCQLS